MIKSNNPALFLPRADFLRYRSEIVKNRGDYYQQTENHKNYYYVDYRLHLLFVHLSSFLGKYFLIKFLICQEVNCCIIIVILLNHQKSEERSVHRSTDLKKRVDIFSNIKGLKLSTTQNSQ